MAIITEERLKKVFKDLETRLDTQIEEELEEVKDKLQSEVEYACSYLLRELLIELGLKKRPRMTITEKQMKQVLDDYVTPAVLKSVMGDSPIWGKILKSKEKK